MFVETRMSVICNGQGWWLDIITASPNMNLFRAVFCSHIIFIETLKRPVMPLIRPPGAMYRNPHKINLIPDDPQRPDSPLQHGRERNIERNLVFFQATAGLPNR